MTRPITVDGKPFSMVSLTVRRGSRLAGRTVGEIEGELDVSVVLLRRDSSSDPHPAASIVVAERDNVAVLGEPEQIGQVVGASQK